MRIKDEIHIDHFMKTGRFEKGTIFFRSSVKKHWYVICPVCSYDEYVKNGLCDGIFHAYTGSLKEGKRPCRCSKRYMWTKEQYVYRIQQVQTNTVIGFESDKLNTYSKVTMLCSEHGFYYSSVNDLLSKKSGCPKCANMEYNTFYINFVEDNGKLIALKYGVTSNLNKRIQDQNAASVFKIRNFKSFQLSHDHCVRLENLIKAEIPSSYLSKNEMKDGYTETICPSFYEKLVSLIKISVI